MCGRYSLVQPANILQKTFSLSEIVEPILPQYNACPTMQLPVITNLAPNLLQFYRWGLIPSWAKNKIIGSKMINARAESLTTKPSFKYALHHQRCLVPADGYYEWLQTSGIKTPYRIQVKNQSVFAFAGLWENWTSSPPSKPETIYSFTIITVPPVPAIARLHNRMPLILHPHQYAIWLSNDSNINLISTLLQTPDMDMSFYEVNPMVNSVTNNSADVILPATQIQPKLF